LGEYSISNEEREVRKEKREEAILRKAAVAYIILGGGKRGNLL
jgi:hypothetical protein